MPCPTVWPWGSSRAGKRLRRQNPSATPEIDPGQVEALLRKAVGPLERKEGIRVYEVKPGFQALMQRETGYGRTEQGLQMALNEVERYQREVLPQLWVPHKGTRFNLEWIHTLEFGNLLLVAEGLIRNALLRRESRGLHDRWDYPKADPQWFKNIHLRLEGNAMKQWTTDVEFKYWRPEDGSPGEPLGKAVRVGEYKGWRAEPLFKKM